MKKQTATNVFLVLFLVVFGGMITWGVINDNQYYTKVKVSGEVTEYSKHYEGLYAEVAWRIRIDSVYSNDSLIIAKLMGKEISETSNYYNAPRNTTKFKTIIKILK